MLPRGWWNTERLRNWLKDTEQISGRSYKLSSAVKNRSCSFLLLWLEPFGCEMPCPKHRVSWWQPCTRSESNDSWPSELSATHSTPIPLLFLFYVQRCEPVPGIWSSSYWVEKYHQRTREGKKKKWRGEANTLFITLDFITKDLQSSQKSQLANHVMVNKTVI